MRLCARHDSARFDRNRAHVAGPSVRNGRSALAANASEPGATYNQIIMDSKLANESRKALVASAKRLTREERLRTFVRHSKLVMDLAEAARRTRAKSPGGG
jgi:hypothetical protein